MSWFPASRKPQPARRPRRQTLRPAVEPLETRCLLSVSLVKDLETGPIGSYPESITEVNGTIFFVAYDDVHGTELLKTDGTPGGTALVKDIRPGWRGSDPTGLTAVNGTLFFWAEGDRGSGLWKSDGTAAGTVFVKDVFAQDPTAVNGTLFFWSRDDRGWELWKSDGTAAGTVPVRDFCPGPCDSMPSGDGTLAAVGATLFFSVRSSAADNAPYELWKTDGTEAGTVRVRAANAGGPAGPIQMAAAPGRLFFNGYTTAHGRELWTSDGTAAGTVRVADLNQGAAGSDPRDLTYAAGALYFTAVTPGYGRELFRSDGTPPGTGRVTDINPGGAAAFRPGYSAHITELTPLQVLFWADDGVHGPEPWVSDGTPGGAAPVKDLFPGPDGSYGSQPVRLGGRVYFIAHVDAWSAPELWHSDGTPDGTAIVSPGLYVTSLVVARGRLYFGAVDGQRGHELWASDGTAAGTALAVDVNPGNWSSWLDHGRTLFANGQLFFNAAGNLGVTDGTPHGTRLLTYDGNRNTNLVAFDNSVFYFESRPGLCSHLWRTDGSSQGAIVGSFCWDTDQPVFLAAAGGTLFIATKNELWKSDGTYNSMVWLGQVNADGPPTAVGGTLYFSAYAAGGRELWKSNGTAVGTGRVQDINPGPNDSAPEALTNVGGTLYFTADDGVHGRELWTTDGTPGGTRRVADLNPGAGGSDPAGLTVLNGFVYFSAFAPATGRELYRSDGTSVTLVKNIRPGAAGSDPAGLTVVNGVLYFAADGDARGRELWKSNGTPGGTVFVKDIHAGAAGSDPAHLTAFGGKLYFTAYRAVTGRELWSSAGTALTTTPVAQIAPGSASAFHTFHDALLTPAGDQLFFVADDRAHGRELWRYQESGAGPFGPSGDGSLDLLADGRTEPWSQPAAAEVAGRVAPAAADRACRPGTPPEAAEVVSSLPEQVRGKRAGRRTADVLALDAWFATLPERNTL